MKFAHDLARSLAVLTIGMFAASLASAHTVEYTATLSGTNESPANASPGIGSVVVRIDYDLLTMEITANFSGLLGNTTASHIHCCTTTPGAGNVGVATTTPSFPSFPTGVTAGTYTNTFDLALASSYNAAFITANGGSVSLALSALALGLDSGKAYFNIHSSMFPGGEIRGFLVAAPVPLPAAIWLFGSGVLGVFSMARRRRSKAVA